MTQVTVGNTPTKLASAGNREFLAIYNNDSNPIFLCFDGATDAALNVALTVNNGFPLGAGQWMSLNNDEMKNVNNHDVYAISAAGNADVRLQGV